MKLRRFGLGDLCGQQLSTFSARAIWARVIALPDDAKMPEGFLRLDETPTLRKAGLSGGKVVSMRAVAQAVVAGGTRFCGRRGAAGGGGDRTTHRDQGASAHGRRNSILLFCAGHPDIFPAGDLALKKAVRDGLGLAALPSTKELIAIAAKWSPHRGAATLLFFRYFHALYDKVGVAV